MIKDVAKEKILEVILSFDENFRGTKEWLNWETRGNHKYAISYENSYYPVKEIIATATGTPRENFNGGFEANTYLEKRGFNIIKLHNKASDEELEASQIIKDYDGRSLNNLNTILYGPPGTGKTYSVVERALKIIDSKGYQELISNSDRRAEAMIEYKKLIANGRIAFCTFHQSYGYEEFVEGLRSNERGCFEPQSGIFKTMCDAAKTSKSNRVSTYNFDENEIAFHKMSLGNTLDDEGDGIYGYCIENGVVAIGWGRYVDYSDCNDKSAIEVAYKKKFFDEELFNVEAISRFKLGISVGDVILVSHGTQNVKAIGKVTGEYYYDINSPIRYRHFRKVEWIYKDVMIPVKQVLKDKVLSQQTIYSFNKKDINFENLYSFIAAQNGTGVQNYVLVIDEINRGNISKIFGELITLIEPDKRLGGENEITVTLPYSGENFGVPRNLYIIGTMNTADRSLALLDTALRRRFCFTELMPDYELLSENVEGVNVRKLLQILNARIEFLYDRDHTIGHAYFMGAKAVQEILDIMKDRIIPLLQEYFYEDWEKVEMVLNGSGNEDHSSYFLIKKELNSDRIFGEKFNGEQQEKYRYRIAQNPTIEALQRIYEGFEDA